MWAVLIASQWKEKQTYLNSTVYISVFLPSWNAVCMPVENMVWNGYHKVNPVFEGPTWPWLGKQPYYSSELELGRMKEGVNTTLVGNSTGANKALIQGSTSFLSIWTVPYTPRELLWCLKLCAKIFVELGPRSWKLWYCTIANVTYCCDKNPYFWY